MNTWAVGTSVASSVSNVVSELGHVVDRPSSTSVMYPSWCGWRPCTSCAVPSVLVGRVAAVAAALAAITTVAASGVVVVAAVVACGVVAVAAVVVLAVVVIVVLGVQRS